jgi:hypothetical protein
MEAFPISVLSLRHACLGPCVLKLAAYVLMKVATGSGKHGVEGCVEEGEAAVDSRLAEDTNCTSAWMLMGSA